MIPITLAYTQIEWSLDNATWVNATNTNNNFTIIEELDNGINESTQYYFRLRHVYDNDNSGWVYLTVRSETSGEISMSSLAVVGFLTLLSLLVLFLPKFVERFNEKEYTHTLIKGLIYALGILLLSLTSSVVASMSDNFGLGVNQEVFRFMFLLNWTAYCFIFFTILIFGKRSLDLWRMDKVSARRGDDGHD